MNLSEHFTLDELTVTTTGLDNTPGPDEIANLKALCIWVLEPIRAINKKPLTIRSGYRSLAVNKKVGGATGSQHRKGEAADFYVSGIPLKTLFDSIVDSHIIFDQIILERPNVNKYGWIHVSNTTTSSPRRQVLAYIPVDGAPKYIAYDLVRYSLDETGKEVG